MKTDSIFYNIFQEFPFVFFALLGIPAESANQYQFTSQEVKQLAFRLDGLFLPIIPDPQLPFYVVEVQFQPDPTLYYRLFAELFIYLKQYQPPHPWQLVVIYPNRQTERQSSIHFQEMLALPQITRIYINELSASETASLPIKLIKLVIEPDNTAENFAIDLARQAETEISDTTARKNFINLLETIIVYKLPQKTREEVAAMFSLTDLKQTRFYQDVFAEGQAEAEAKVQVEKQRQKVAMFRLFGRGLTTEDIATIFNLPLAEVTATIAESQKEQAEQAEQN
ncbi:Rpn family recombination-promoting nuclease/putative transposase [Microcoleus sp. herbarium8]|uniref:Rpn family recombination-promoting nuclease/putative transposase n=1 Tax=Microcoleus sp. herbarium8 TaxID=3055436 RepID=UPI002FD30AC2